MTDTAKTQDANLSIPPVQIPQNAILTVPFELLIIDHKWNARVREHMDVPAIGAENWQTIEELASRIKNEGQQTPLLVIPEGKKYKVIAGFRRCAALEKLKAATAIVEVQEIKRPEDADVMNLAENLGRNNLRPYELAKKCSEMNKKYKMSGETIAKRIGNKSRQYIVNLITCYNKLAPAILNAWSNPTHPAHKLCTTDKLRTWASLSLDEQMVQWDEACGRTSPIQEGETEERDGGETRREKKMRRAPEVERMLLALKKARGKKEYLTGVTDALKWVTCKLDDLKQIKFPDEETE